MKKDQESVVVVSSVATRNSSTQNLRAVAMRGVFSSNVCVLEDGS